MGRDATKAAGNPWYQARKKAAEYDDRLCSRESAAEQLGMSVSSLADAELGNTKFMPVDKAVLMADRYNAPWLLNHYCLNECPIGCRHSLSDEVVGIDRVTVKLLKSLKTEKLGDVKDTLLDIAADGKITEDEKPALQEVLAYLDDLAKTVSELKTIGEMALNEDGDAHGSKYRDHFWSFENSDVNGQLDMGWANNGKLNLRSLDWPAKLEGSITFEFARKMQFSYVRSTGGYWALREADKTYNDWNREQLRALKMMHGRLFLGSINFHGDQRKKVIAGKEGVYEELLDQMVYNFGCDFAVPTPDKKLEELIRAWNGDEQLPKRLVDVEAMTGRVEQLGGLNLIWY